LTFCGTVLNQVQVELRNQANTQVYSQTETDSNGAYDLSAPASPPADYRIVLKANNAAAEVRLDTYAVPQEFHLANVPPAGACAARNFALETVEPFSCNAPAITEPGRRGLALWIAGDLFRARAALRSALSLPPSEPPQVVVHYPSGGTDPNPNDTVAPDPTANAFYFGGPGHINIGQYRVDAIYHEYGHYLQDRLASWIAVPDYGGTCPARHFFGCDQGCQVWPYFEAIGHLVDAFVWDAIFGSVTLTPISPTHPFNSAPVAAGRIPSVIETPSTISLPGTCTATTPLSTTCVGDLSALPKLTEGAIAGALWDLVDGRRCANAPAVSCTSNLDCGVGDQCLPQDTSGAGNVLDEASLSLRTVFDAIQFMGAANFPDPCSTSSSRPNPLTADQFVEAWRALHAGPQPQLWSAFAANDMNYDSAPPSPAVVVAQSAPAGIWTADPILSVSVDQQDDFSGVARYFAVFDTSASEPTSIWFPILSRLKQQVDTAPETLELDAFTTTVFSEPVPASGAYYFHAKAADYSGRQEVGMLTVGPLLVDLEFPQLTTLAPTSTSTFVDTGAIAFHWRVEDDGPAVSGVHQVRIRYTDMAASYSVEVLQRDYSGPGVPPVVTEGPGLVDDQFSWPIPVGLPLTNDGRIFVSATDVAGNEVFAETLTNIRIVAEDAERDNDGDGARDTEDAFPNDPAEQLDTDGDGVGDKADLDDDADGLSDAEEAALGTDPLAFDTDGDGAGDGAEVATGTDPLDPASVAVAVPALGPGGAAMLAAGLLLLAGPRLARRSRPGRR